MTYHLLLKCLSLLTIIIRASAGDSGNIDYQANSGDVNVDSQTNSDDVTGWLMAQGAYYNNEGPAQAQFYDGQASDWLASDKKACSRPDTYDIQSGPRLDKRGVTCKNDSPPTMQQGKPKPVPEHEDIVIPDAMPRWPTMQLQPNRQNCDRETYNVPACARREGARFVSLYLYDLPVCRPYFDGPCHDSELLWCCQLLVPTWLDPTTNWAYAGLNCALQTNLLAL